MRTLDRSRPELAEFLRTRRERLSPEDVGLPRAKRRRTPGLRREEVAALAGVGLAWYTWLEQGRDIGVSSDFLDNLARVLKLDAAERRHLFLLAHARPPAEPGKTFCSVPPLAARLVSDLAPHAAYIINLRWDILMYNGPANHLFTFDKQAPARRNLLWMLFTDPALRQAFAHWEKDVPAVLESFRRDYAGSRDDPSMRDLIDELEKVSPEFKAMWRQQDVHAPCTGVRTLAVDGALQTFDYTSLLIDGGKHLRLIVYALSASTPA
jgi:transcriptional regulator with XRE-family HTH domain